MGKLFINVLIIFFPLIFSISFASGGITHMFLAKEAIASLQNTELQKLLTDNINAYLVGSYYPDSGYTAGNQYGEDSHWDAFIDAYTDYLQETYKNPIKENPQLVAFLFGCASHRVSDDIVHNIFYHQSAPEDFHGDIDKAHHDSDVGIDLLLLVDKNQWSNYPSSWWVPVSDLVKIYHRMGKAYTTEQIIKGNVVISAAGTGERAIALAAYPYLTWVSMPWTAKHYYDWPQGGMKMNIEKIVDYQMALWKTLKNNAKHESRTQKNTSINTSGKKLLQMQEIMDHGDSHVDIIRNADGSVELENH